MHHHWLTLSLCSLLYLCLPSPAGAAEPVDVYLFAGQSNMQGIAKITEMESDWKQPITEAMFWNGKTFETLQPDKTKLSTRKGEFGPELGFARELAKTKPGKKFYIIKFHRSGQPLHHGWHGNKWVGGKPTPNRANFYPGTNKNDPNKGRHYTTMMKTFNTAMASLKKKGTQPVIRGFLWMQGEQDSKYKTSAEEYATSLKRFKRRLEEDLQIKQLPFIYGQVLAHEPARARFTHRKEIRQSMAAADMRSGKSQAVTGLWMVPTEGMPIKKDLVHYNAAGMKKLGTAFAKGMLACQKMLSQKPKETAKK